MSFTLLSPNFYTGHSAKLGFLCFGIAKLERDLFLPPGMLEFRRKLIHVN